MRPTQRIKPFLEYIQAKWEADPDQRFGQLLINLGIIEDSIGNWSKEFNDYPLPHETMRKVIYWGTSEITAEGFTLHQVPIYLLSDNHIKNILRTQHHVSTFMTRLFKAEQKYRKANNIKVADSKTISRIKLTRRSTKSK